MQGYDSLEDFLSGIEIDYARKENVYFDGSINELSAFEEDDFHIQYPDMYNYTKKNVFYVIIGYLIIKYSGKYILKTFVDDINTAIKEVEINYKKLDLTEEEQLEILNLAEKVKNELPKLKVFTDHKILYALEKKEYLESQQK